MTECVCLFDPDLARPPLGALDLAPNPGWLSLDTVPLPQKATLTLCTLRFKELVSIWDHCRGQSNEYHKVKLH